MDFRIKEARERACIDQKSLADMLGIAPSTLSGYESGSHDPKSDKLSQIADICGVTTDYLLGRDDLSSKKEVKQSPVERLISVVDDLTPEQACFLVKIVERLLALNPDAYAAAKQESRTLWKD